MLSDLEFPDLASLGWLPHKAAVLLGTLFAIAAAATAG
jgi:hypothetical protein